MINDTDIVSLKWVTDLLNEQVEKAEQALVDYSNDPGEKRHLLLCMWSAHQITSTLRILGMRKGQMLTLEMERCLNYLYRDKVQGEYRKLAMGALMQALKVFPAYLAHAQTARMDSGQGLETHVNDLRRWLSMPPRPQAFFFHFDVPENAGITLGASPESDSEIRRRANVMLATYLNRAKPGLRRRNTRENMKDVARIARKMQTLFVGTEPERFWMTLIGLCEGIAGGLIIPDECIAQIFKTGAFLIKFAGEHGAKIDESVDYDNYLQQMLYYIAACKSRPLHITAIRNTFGIDSSTIDNANQSLIHTDALITALTGALTQLNKAEEFIAKNGVLTDDGDTSQTQSFIEAAQYRLDAAGQLDHADSLARIYDQLGEIGKGKYNGNRSGLSAASDAIVKAIVDVKLDVEHKINHGLDNTLSAREFELREGVINATFAQMGMMEDHLQTMLRRHGLANALKARPETEQQRFDLVMALNRYLNKSDQGHQALREAVREAGERDNSAELYELAQQFYDEQNEISDADAIEKSAKLMLEISGALHFSGMTQEAAVVDYCHDWLIQTSVSGGMVDEEQFSACAQAFAHLEMHLQRSLIDPLGDTGSILMAAKRCADKLNVSDRPSPLSVAATNPEIAPESKSSDVLAPIDYVPSLAQEHEEEVSVEAAPDAIDEVFYEPEVEDADASADFREAFVEEATELSEEINALLPQWFDRPDDKEICVTLRRQFHTLKGSGRAVGANILSELGCAVQDIYDAILERQTSAKQEELQKLIQDVADSLPELIAGYEHEDAKYKDKTRDLTRRSRAQLREFTTSGFMPGDDNGDQFTPVQH
ncbi:MAG: hypothetical protein CSA53_01995 [Gammaproteobacteria bacterium]|nr:MAG: hypothetical protein CSA53_01995 [Gammaproteobacteria bacterium]